MMRRMAEPSSCARSEVRSEGVPEMTKRFAIGACSVLLIALVLPHVQHNVLGGAEEPAEVDHALFELGEELYEAECAVCHQRDGEGEPPVFPALRDNERLEHIDLIVSNIHLGEGAMPAFPHFGTEEIAAVATYIRNAWDNEFTGVREEEVATILDEIGEVVDAASIWDGVYLQAQADRGKPIYQSHCLHCHGTRGDGGAGADPSLPDSPAIAGFAFLRNWDGRNVASLYEFTRATMPQINPGSLSDQQYVDVIAYTFELSRLPAGDEELSTDPAVLARIVIEQEPERD